MNSWIDRNVEELKDKKILYLCMEMLMPELSMHARSGNFKGGLGILAGDTMEGLKKIGLDVTAVIPMYKYEWIQNITEDNRQEIQTKEIDYSGEPIEIVHSQDSKPLVLNIEFEGKRYPIKVYRLMRAGVPVYLLHNPEVFDVLYTGDRKQRLKQEVITGKAAAELLNAVNLNIDFIHLNEAHTVTAACCIKEREEYSKIPILFTTHTPVEAGMEKYPADWFKSMNIPEKYFELFHSGEVIDFTHAALKISSLTNGVSKEHGEVTKNMFLPLRNKIIGITNGSSRSWQAPELRNPENVKPEMLWETTKKYKKKAMEDASSRVKKYFGIDIKFDENKPAVGFFRRFAGYKKQYPMFKDIIHAVCGERGKKYHTVFGELVGLGLQVFAGGMAHPSDEERKEWVRHFCEWTKSEELKGKFAFLPGYNHDMLMHGARGYEIWVSTPEKNQEACGTSDQRSAMNGNINISTYTGGAREYLSEINPESADGSAFFIDPYDARTLYRKLEIASNLFYNCIEGGESKCKKIKHNAYLAGQNMIIENMAKAYASEFYLKALRLIK